MCTGEGRTECAGEGLVNGSNMVLEVLGEHSAYHHGEASLSGTIVSMAQALLVFKIKMNVHMDVVT